MFDIIIKTFNRYPSLKELLRSIETFYPNQKIIIADDSIEYGEDFYNQFDLNLTVLNLGVDVGLSHGRNRAIEKVKTEYALLLDDDFVFDERTNIEKLLTVAQHTNADVVGGQLDTNGKIDGFNQFMEIKDRVLTYRKANTTFENIKGIRYQKVDIVYNFGLFRKKYRWDENIKIKGEHSDFFLSRQKENATVIYCPDVTIKHKPARPANYKHYRGRNDGYFYFMQKHNLRQIISSKNLSTTVRNNTLIFKRI